jgi:hypothetical protein
MIHGGLVLAVGKLYFLALVNWFVEMLCIVEYIL